MNRPAKIMVPVDFSKRSERAIEYTTHLVAAFGAELVLMANVSLHERDLLKDYAAIEKCTIAEAAEATLWALINRYAPEAASSVIVRFHGAPADGIIHAAEDVQADAIVMASHGRSGMTRFMLGSVAEKVVRHAEVPVTIIPTRDI